MIKRRRCMQNMGKNENRRERSAVLKNPQTGPPLSTTAVDIRHVGKRYLMYDKPLDRLKQVLWRGRKNFFTEFWALDDICIRIEKGETVGIIGSNGSGKSTLLQLVCSIHQPTIGELHVNGRVAALLELGAGFNPEFTGEENVRVNAAIMGLSDAQIEACLPNIIAFADIGQFIKQPVKLYSSGMYVRLAFATAINVSADILVVDEALAVGDARFRQKCMVKIRDFCRSGTVIFVSHDTEAIVELCTRAIWIESGKLRMDNSPKTVAEHYLEFMYGDDSQPGNTPPHLSDDGEVQTLNDMCSIDDRTRQFGNRTVTIRAVNITSPDCPNGVLYAGRPCNITLVLQAQHKVVRPVVGFIVKDRLGRRILGENTDVLKRQVPALESGATYRVWFNIPRWPDLQPGDYSVSIAVADGTAERLAQCHWLHDAVIFHNIPSRPPVGIFSIENTSVNWDRLTE